MIGEQCRPCYDEAFVHPTWMYTVCRGLSVRILGVIVLYFQLLHTLLLCLSYTFKRCRNWLSQQFLSRLQKIKDDIKDDRVIVLILFVLFWLQKTSIYVAANKHCWSLATYSFCYSDWTRTKRAQTEPISRKINVNTFQSDVAQMIWTRLWLLTKMYDISIKYRIKF